MEKNTKLLFDEESRKIWKRISAFVGTVLFSCMFFCCTVWAEASYDENLAAHRQTAANTGSICGTLFLGYVYGGVGDNLADDSAYLDYVLNRSGCAEEFTFLRNIPSDRIVDTEGGKEVFCIYPCDENASVTVYEYILSEANDYNGETGAVLYQSESGDPILLRCNVSEGISNCQVVITDSQGETLIWQPVITLYDGTISTPWYAPFVYDATYKVVEGYGQDTYPEDEYLEYGYEDQYGEEEYWYEGSYVGEEYGYEDTYGYDGEYKNESLYDDGRTLNLDGTTYIMQVTKCEEWVSLREYPDVNSARLAQIPLGAYIYDCQWYSDEFVFGQVNGQWGYVLSQYLTLVDAVLDYEEDDYYDNLYYGDYEGSWAEDAEPHGYFNYTPLPYDTITKDGIEIINYSTKGYTILASRLYDLGEVMRVGCYVNGTEPYWGYVTSVDTITELSATKAFLAGTADDPKVMIYNSIKGLYMIDLETGELLWERNGEELGLSGGLCYAVGEDGTIYLAGYYSTDILAVSMDGTILWRNDADNSAIYWPYQIKVLGDEVVVDYGSGSENGHFVVAYGLDGSNQWVDIKNEA